MNAAPPTIENMSVNHCRANVLVSQEFLHCPNIIARFEKVCGEAVAKRVAATVFHDASLADGRPDRFLNCPMREMMPARSPVTRVARDFSVREKHIATPIG